MKEFGEVLKNVSLKKYSSFGMGGEAEYLVKPYDTDSLVNLIKYLKENNMKYYILGNGTNILFDDEDFDGVIIKLDNFKDISFEDNLVTCGSGANLASLVRKTIEEGFTSLYFAAMIPGSVGGSVVGNAGCYGHEIMHYLKSVEVVDQEGNVKVIPKEDIEYGYRYTSLKGKYIILNATFVVSKGDVNLAKESIKEKNEQRINTQPLDKRNVGSIFRNPEGDSAGRLIDELGLKGYKIGGAMVSEKHANFIINEDNATFEDVTSLIKFIQKKVKKAYDIDLVTEVQIVKWDQI